MELFKIYGGTRYLVLYGLKDMMQFMIGLDILYVKQVVLPEAATRGVL